ncbi:hypothetical protein DFJ77DRAFT_428055 [Powellomyces hirtus]|nr:hypothetical protein DFJ77DRAFT_428055 [Powellomyces hirtus]
MSRPSSGSFPRSRLSLSAQGKASTGPFHLEELLFVDTFTRELPGDPLTQPAQPPLLGGPPAAGRPSSATLARQTEDSHAGGAAPSTNPARTARAVRGACYSLVTPDNGCTHPLYIASSPSAIELLGIDREEPQRREFGQFLSGARTLPRAHPWAAIYGGHQFGCYAGQLGDGRCVSIGEVLPPPPPSASQPAPGASTSSDISTTHWDIQLKGAGLTPYSRFGDGLTTLGSCVREFVAAEYMHSIGIPTTRALAVVATQVPVYRGANGDIFHGAVLTRLSPSWIRFGSFELFHYRNDKERVKLLADYVIKYHFADLLQPPVLVDVELNVYARFFQEVIRRTAELVAAWQAIGFVHGALNTDNMSILGITLNYGAFGFLDRYDPYWTLLNLADRMGRYRFEHQPKIALWNLSKLGRTLAALIAPPPPASLPPSRGGGSLVAAHVVRGEEIVRELLKGFEDLFIESYTRIMRSKLGLRTEQATDLTEIIEPLLQLLADAGADYTLFFRESNENDPPLPSDITTSRHNRKSLRSSTTSFGRTGSTRTSSSSLGTFKAEIRSRWEDWSDAYRARLEDDVPHHASSSSSSTTRRQRMSRANPPFIPRSHVLNTLAAAVAARLPEPDNRHPIRRAGLAQPDPDLDRALKILCRTRAVNPEDKEDERWRRLWASEPPIQ